MVTVCSQHGLDTRPKHAADAPDTVLNYGGPLLLNLGLQGVDVAVGVAQDLAPDPIVQGQTVRAGGWPHRGWPESSQVLPEPCLLCLGLVARDQVLLPYIVAPRVGGVQARLHNVHEDLLLCLGPNLEALREPVGWHPGPHDPQHHGTGRVLSLIDGRDLLDVVSEVLVVLGVPGLVHGKVLLVLKIRIRGPPLLLDKAHDSFLTKNPGLLGLHGSELAPPSEKAPSSLTARLMLISLRLRSRAIFRIVLVGSASILEVRSSSFNLTLCPLLPGLLSSKAPCPTRRLTFFTVDKPMPINSQISQFLTWRRTRSSIICLFASIFVDTCQMEVSWASFKTQDSELKAL